MAVTAVLTTILAAGSALAPTGVGGAGAAVAWAGAVADARPVKLAFI